MNVSPASAPQIEQTQIEEVISKLEVKLSHLEKAIAYNKDVFRDLDGIANKLNPDAFHKNHPVCASESVGNSNAMESKPPHNHRSGIMLRFHNVINDLELVTKLVDEFTVGEVSLTINFFKNQI